MKVLLVNGSPHKEGCTYTALCEVEKALKQEGIETEIFWIGNKPISGCIGCRTCVSKKSCVFDDVVNEFVSKATDVDGFVFGTPVHYASASGAMTSFIEYFTQLVVVEKMSLLINQLLVYVQLEEQVLLQHMIN